MSKNLLAVCIGEFGWELMTIQARARYRARQGEYDKVAVCTTTNSFDLYRDFAHEFTTYDLPGVPLCNHRRITPNEPRIDTRWLKTNDYFKSYVDAGYDILYPPEAKPDVRNTPTDQDFIRFGESRTHLYYDIVIHARNRGHMANNNWPEDRWQALVARLKGMGVTLASIGLPEQALGLPGVDDHRGKTLLETMDVMASSKLVIGPSSGPICLASLCGTPHLTWFGGNNYVGSGLKDRFERYWNPLKTKVWALKMGWQPAVDSVYLYVKSALKELSVDPLSAQDSAPEVRKVTSKPAVRPVVRAEPKEAQSESTLSRRAAVVRQRRIEKANQQKAEDEAALAAVEMKEEQKKSKEVKDQEALPELTGESLVIRVAPGIGDFSWIYSKFCTLGVPLTVQICGGGPARTGPFAEILPMVQASSYGALPFPTLRRRSLPADTTKAGLMKYFPNQVTHIECNTHLENGHRIEEWMPEIDVNHHYDINISDKRAKDAEDVLPSDPFIAIYASSDGGVNNWHAWDENVWVKFMGQLRAHVGDINFVIIGASWDAALARRMTAAATDKGIKLTNLVDKLHIASSLHVIKKSKYFISFPSGLSILSAVMSEPCTMFYPAILDKMMRSYVDPELTKANIFNELQFCQPAVLMDWLINVYKIKDRL